MNDFGADWNNGLWMVLRDRVRVRIVLNIEETP